MRTAVAALALLVCAWTAPAQELPERNLLPNPSFEDIAGEAPVGWIVEQGAARARIEIVEGQARSGRRALRIANSAPMSPNVFGRVWRNVRVSEGTTYTVSCYVRSDEPGTAWIGGGKAWGFRFPFPVAREWTRVTGTFRADAVEIPIMVVSESPTEALYVDDLQLEQGEAASEFAYLAPLGPGEARLSVTALGPGGAGENLIADSSFEAGPGPLPEGWAWQQRNTDATASVDTARAASGARSLRLTNGTPFGAHVYGLLTRDRELVVEPNTTYTLSCAFRTLDDTTAWIGGGPDWLVRLMAPRNTQGRWRRVSTTFRTGGEQRTFALLACTESPTEGAWFDDVKLEPGSIATPYTPEDAAARPSITLQVPAQVAVDDVVRVEGWVSVPEPGPELRVEARFSAEGGPDVEAIAPVTAGLSGARFAYAIPEEMAEECHFALRLVAEDGTAVAEERSDFRLVSAGANRQTIADGRARAEGLRARLEALRADGVDASYALVSLTVLERFLGFAEEDNHGVWVPRARDQLDDLRVVGDRCEAELARLEAGGAALQAPRWIAGPTEIEGGCFRGSVRWPDGRVEDGRPVYFSGYGHFDSVKRDIELMPDYGLNIIQIEIGPSATLPTEDSVNTQVVEQYVGFLDRAAAAGVAVNILLSPHYMPEWAYAKWPDIGNVNGGFARFSIDNPHAREVLEKHLRLVVPRFAGHPALHSFCLSNEPVYRDATKDPWNRTGYTAWLTAKYRNVAALSDAHGATYTSFEEAPLWPLPAAASATPAQLEDYFRFNNERFAGWHRWMADVIHSIAPEVPVHAKAMNTVFSHPCRDFGVDPELFCDFSQIAGNDCWKYWAGDRGGYASDWQGENMYFDLQRSIAGQPIFNSENHIIVDRETGRIPAEHIRNILWQSAIHGEGASTAWVWERSFDDRSDFAGSIMHRPLCAEAHGVTGLDLMRLAPEVDALSHQPARVALVYSVSSLIAGQDYERILARTYEALNWTGEHIDFVTERQLARSEAGRYALVIAPGVTSLPPEALAGLRAYAAAGGRVLTVGAGALVDGASVVHLEEAPAKALLPAMLPLLDALPGARRVRALEATTGELAWGVEVRSATLNGRVLVNLTNYGAKLARVRLDVDGGGWTDLFRMEPAPEVLELPPAGVLLLGSGVG